ncbi:MAG: hypothetical protein BGO69_10945 [Bacteroidetes bacterium 46-16]|nr:MAG: hypothetical protein BGO69_10945 [Bacteroidetes bacterium 46-16]
MRNIKLLPVITLLLLMQPTPTQAWLGLSLGYPHVAYRSDISSLGPMFSIEAEGRVHRIGIGGIASFGIFKGYRSQWPLEDYGGFGIIGFRLNYYIIRKPHFDLYGGGMLSGLVADNGIYITPKDPKPYYRPTLASESMGFKAGFQVGTHVWLSHHFGAFAEVSYGTALFSVGIVCKHRRDN